MFRLLAVASSLCLAALPCISILAQEAPPAGKLTVAGKEYSLKHFVAYETGDEDEKVVAVIASDRPLDDEPHRTDASIPSAN